jgi:1-acyl-sn-glycerol-3-phosphate acyltransferase
MELNSPLARDYVSTPARPGWWARTLPSAAFYLKLAGIVWRASRHARRGTYTDARWIESSYATARAVEHVGGIITVENTAAIAGLTTPAVIVGNHMSTLETFLLACVVYPHRPLTFVVKRQLVEMPVFKHVMRSRHPVVVGRENPRDDLRIMLEEGEARLRQGLSIAVFPQRTRAAVWLPGEFNSIGVKLAKRVGVPVVPLAVRTDLWSIGRLVKDCGPIHPERPVRLSFGEPMAVTGNGRDAQAAIVAFITARMQEWGVPIVAPDPAAPAEA